MLEHHVSHLPIAASAELEGVIDEAEPVVLGVVPVRVDPNAQTFALIESTGEVDRVEMIGAAPLPLTYSGDDPWRL
jgi:hypothetical protein